MSPWTVLVNLRAGSDRTVLDRTRRALEALGVPAQVETPRDAGAVEGTVAAAVASGVTRFVAVGGDGTLNVVVNALMRHEWPAPPTLGILPAGTGCDFARTFALPQQLEAAAAHLVGDRTYPVDVGWLRGTWGTRYFLNVAQAGVGGAAADTSTRLSARLGSSRYLLSFAVRLPGFRLAQVELVAGSRSYRGRAIAVIFANAQFFAGGWNVAPKATLMDGELDVQVINARKVEALRVVPKLVKGLHLTDRSVHRFSTAEFQLDTDPAWPVEADGEYLGTTPVSGGVLPGAIDVKL